MPQLQLARPSRLRLGQSPPAALIISARKCTDLDLRKQMDYEDYDEDEEEGEQEEANESVIPVL